MVYMTRDSFENNLTSLSFKRSQWQWKLKTTEWTSKHRQECFCITLSWSRQAWGGRWKLWFVGKINSSISTIIVHLVNQCLFLLKNTRALFICWLHLWFAEVSLFLATSCFPFDGLSGSVGVTRGSTVLSFMKKKNIVLFRKTRTQL